MEDNKINLDNINVKDLLPCFEIYQNFVSNSDSYEDDYEWLVLQIQTRLNKIKNNNDT